MGINFRKKSHVLMQKFPPDDLWFRWLEKVTGRVVT